MNGLCHLLVAGHSIYVTVDRYTLTFRNFSAEYIQQYLVNSALGMISFRIGGERGQNKEQRRTNAGDFYRKSARNQLDFKKNVIKRLL